MGLVYGGLFGQNGQKLHEDYKINISGAKQQQDMGGKSIYWVVGGSLLFQVVIIKDAG